MPHAVPQPGSGGDILSFCCGGTAAPGASEISAFCPQVVVSGAMQTCAPGELDHHYKKCRSAILIKKVELSFFENAIMEDNLGNYLRAHRKKTGLTQRELGMLVGYSGNRGQVSKHEFTRALPSLLIAAAYEVVFCASSSQIFPGLYDVVGDAVEQNLAELEEKLRQNNGKGPHAAATAQKLEWVCKRRSRSYSIR